MVTTHPDSDWKGSGQSYFPAFSLPVVSHGGYFIPLDRGIIYSGEQAVSFWNIIVSPGKVWKESADNGYSRASFPFVLTENAIGQARNGVATFVFNGGEISNVAIQITQETAPVDEYTRTEFHARVPVRYEPAELPDAESNVSDFEAELEARYPVRPWSDLVDSESSRVEFNSEIPTNELSAGALLMDDVLYMQPVETRTAGPFPYPEEMRHGVFSVTKTLGMGLAMFYAAEHYGDNLFDALITDYVPTLAGHAGWAGVTFGNTLDMATGTEGRDEGNYIGPFIRARTAEARLRMIASLSDAPPAPGESFQYASTHTFVLSYALNQYVKAREGPDADYWLTLKEDVLDPLHVGHIPLTRSREVNGELGTPMMGWGSYPNVHEAVKIGKLLQDEGNLQGRQVLSRAKVREALFRTLSRGYEAGGTDRYLHSVWLVSVFAWPCIVGVPTMAGHGGSYVLMIPSGLTVIRFSDSVSYAVAPMVQAVERYRSSCR
jgi:hypothetical protein